jgi:phage terminase large subunit GpA
MTKRRFAEGFVRLKGEPFSLEKRPYLQAVYESTSRRIVLRASRQVEKTTFIVNSILYYATTIPCCNILVVCPRTTQARVLSKARLQVVIRNSPMLERCLLGRKPRRLAVTDLYFENGSTVFFRSAFLSSDAVRGIDADFLFIDEYQDIAAGDLPILMENLSHSKHGGVILTGMPKLIDNHLEEAFRRSTAQEFMVPCLGCSEGVLLDEHCLGSEGPECPRCQIPIDPRLGHWVARQPRSKWGDGFWINHLMVPWIDYAELLQRQRNYDQARFRNECMGLPTSLGDHLVTREQLEACCTDCSMAAWGHRARLNYPSQLVGGIDWGGGVTSHTVVTAGYLDAQYRFCVVSMERFLASEEPNKVLEDVAAFCQRLQLRQLAADGAGNGNVYNRMLYERLRRQSEIYAIFYSPGGGAPRQDGCLLTWPIMRSKSLGTVFSRIKMQTLLFPKLEDMAEFLDDFACELAEYNDHDRTIQYTHPENHTDDALHATNYALQLAVYIESKRNQYSEAPPVPIVHNGSPTPPPLAEDPTHDDGSEDDLLD